MKKLLAEIGMRRSSDGEESGMNGALKALLTVLVALASFLGGQWSALHGRVSVKVYEDSERLAVVEKSVRLAAENQEKILYMLEQIEKKVQDHVANWPSRPDRVVRPKPVTEAQ